MKYKIPNFWLRKMGKFLVTPQQLVRVGGGGGGWQAKMTPNAFYSKVAAKVWSHHAKQIKKE